MLFSLILLLSLQDPSARPARQERPDGQAATLPAATRPALNRGPMRVRLLNVREMRSTKSEEEGGNVPTFTRFQFRLRGERLGDIRRFGRAIIDECVDSTGKSLVDAAATTQRDRDSTTRHRAEPERMEQTGLVFEARVGEATRAATHVKKLRGSLRVVYATQHESVYIDNPRQYLGRKIEDARLAEAGIEVSVMPAGNPQRAGDSPRQVVLRFDKGGERIHEIAFLDGWMRAMRSRDFPMTTDQDEPCELHRTEGDLNDESTLAVEFYPAIDDVRIPIELDDVELP